MTASVPTAMISPMTASSASLRRGRMGSSAARGGRSMSPGAGRPNPRPIAWKTPAVKLMYSLQRQEGRASDDVEDAGPDERQDEPEQGSHLVADVTQQVVVDRATLLDGVDDRGEVVVRQDHHRGLLRDLGAGDAHGDPDVCLRSEERRVG